MLHVDFASPGLVHVPWDALRRASLVCRHPRAPPVTYRRSLSGKLSNGARGQGRNRSVRFQANMQTLAQLALQSGTPRHELHVFWQLHEAAALARQDISSGLGVIRLKSTMQGGMWNTFQQSMARLQAIQQRVAKHADGYAGTSAESVECERCRSERPDLLTARLWPPTPASACCKAALTVRRWTADGCNSMRIMR